ncbi:MAG TPA: three-Cys-motif partner protein TcmP [Thermomicrobiaceae bacterium]|nr:three-Cys-motif partner protein TcmP [Thermomicrobiaceae bacterium]
MKLDVLGKDLPVYTTILHRQRSNHDGWPSHLHYVDAFAGLGRYPSDADVRAYVEGSPLRALACDPPFETFWFIERNTGRLQKLEDLVRREYPDRDVRFLRGDANEMIQSRVIPGIGVREHAFFFLDPYGLHIDFETIDRLADVPCDVLINLSTMGITRLMDRRSAPTGWRRDTLQRVLGSEALTALESRYTRRPTIFGEVDEVRGPITANEVAQAYVDAVSRRFAHASDSLIMRNPRGVPIYGLILVSQNRTAVRVGNDIIKRFREQQRSRPQASHARSDHPGAPGHGRAYQQRRLIA